MDTQTKTTETILDVKTPDGVMTTHVFRPEAAGRWPLVVVYMDAFGVRDAMRDMARRLASEGYVAALPDLFYRSAPVAPFDVAKAFGDPAERSRLMALMSEATLPKVMEDTRALVDAFAADPGVDTTRVGTVGYCMGGGYALAAAGALPDRVRAAASYHGGRLATDAPNSPHGLASKARGRLYIGYAEHDRSFPDDQRERLDEALTAAHVPHTIEPYPAGHGFAIPDTPVYDAAAADRHWATLFALFGDTLA